MSRKEKVTVAVAAVIVVAVIALIVWVTVGGCAKSGRATYAIIRYFDGSSEMVPVVDVSWGMSTVTVETAWGSRICASVQNIMIIEEKDETETR